MALATRTFNCEHLSLISLAGKQRSGCSLGVYRVHIEQGRLPTYLFNSASARTVLGSVPHHVATKMLVIIASAASRVADVAAGNFIRPVGEIIK